MSRYLRITGIRVQKQCQKHSVSKATLYDVISSLNPLESVLEPTPNRALERIQLCSYWSMKIVSPLSVLMRSTLNNLTHDGSPSFARAARIHFLWPHWDGKQEHSLTIITTVIINLLTWNSAFGCSISLDCYNSRYILVDFLVLFIKKKRTKIYYLLFSLHRN